MAVHTDTNVLLPYHPAGYPNIPGGEANYLIKELQKQANSINKIIEVMKLMEARMNTNGLT